MEKETIEGQVQRLVRPRVEARNASLIQVLKDELWREQEKIRRAEEEIFNIKNQLLELGVELPFGE